MGTAFFEQVADALVGFLPPELRGFSSRRTGRNLKVWFGDDAREHFEVQLISPTALAAGGVSGRAAMVEVGFHAEHGDAPRNDAVLARLLAHEPVWRLALGDTVQVGPFLGHQATWRRASELWPRPSPLGTEAAVEAAERLAAYICALEPVRAGDQPRPSA
jgi:hypothetical protein